VYVRRRLATGSGRVGGLPGSLGTLRCGRVGGAARMIDVRFMVPIVRTRDSSNHSHDHTHDHYHRRPAMSDDYPDHSLPQVSASEHTPNHSHVVRIAASWVGSTSLPSSSSDDPTTARLDRVQWAMPPGCRPS
jgi:hypothetical protein